MHAESPATCQLALLLYYLAVDSCMLFLQAAAPPTCAAQQYSTTAVAVNVHIRRHALHGSRSFACRIRVSLLAFLSCAAFTYTDLLFTQDPPSPRSASIALHAAMPAAAASLPSFTLNAATRLPAAPGGTAAAPNCQRSCDWLADQVAPAGSTRLGASKPGGTSRSTVSPATGKTWQTQHKRPYKQSNDQEVHAA
jgi:hypothetical protein